MKLTEASLRRCTKGELVWMLRAARIERERAVQYLMVSGFPAAALALKVLTDEALLVSAARAKGVDNLYVVFQEATSGTRKGNPNFKKAREPATAQDTKHETGQRGGSESLGRGAVGSGPEGQDDRGVPDGADEHPSEALPHHDGGRTGG